MTANTRPLLPSIEVISPLNISVDAIAAASYRLLGSSGDPVYRGSNRTPKYNTAARLHKRKLRLLQKTARKITRHYSK